MQLNRRRQPALWRGNPAGDAEIGSGLNLVAKAGASGA